MSSITPYIPSTITVHLGPPDQWAENVTVPFLDYVKNVVSSEIYPTWEEAAIRANILAVVSFALNRVYTEYYPSRGYDFQITASTAYDQKFIRDRSIFENIGQIVDEMFNDYLRRVGSVEPLAAKFCNGTTATCDGLSQWGSQDLAKQGKSYMEILRYYYGPDIELVMNAPVEDLGDRQNYPGRPVRLGDVGEPVFIIQASLNRISRNYPAIPKIWPADGIYGEKTEEAVKEFQRIFNLTPDGIVGKATWYKLVAIYVGVSRLSELASEGQLYDKVGFQYPGVLREGSRGQGVQTLQYMLAILAQFYPELEDVKADGVFGPATTQAVLAFQHSHGLSPDGVVGEQTWDAIYRDYIGIGNYLERDRVRFPGENRRTHGARIGQDPGMTMEQGQKDQKGGVRV